MLNKGIILKYEKQAGEGRHQFSKRKVGLELSALFIHTTNKLSTNYVLYTELGN